ncbi:hypothetical protein GCM10008986_03510 [Salinibacillus aidingensis]|uniref:Uncharacterized protein n=1 Tax=Salinibacillus aidingensis TaxID=237684 RepID=A0ABP3KL36_9BACI
MEIFNMGIKSKVYKLIRIWNFVDSVRKGKAGKGLERRTSRKLAGKVIRKVFK